ncbi:MAG: glycine--tRNA ligase subunit beta [Bacillota bacterium]
MAQDLLFEIGTEEIPARFMPPALEQLKNLAETGLASRRLNCQSLLVWGTPRRLALKVEKLAERQADIAEEVKGPAVKVAFDAEGKPTKAAEGFARGQGVRVEDLQVRETAGGSYVFAVRRQAGRPVREVLPEFLEYLVHSLSFPKPMRWGYLEMRFARPIRWLVALYGEEEVKIDIGGVKSGRITRGHRFLGRQECTLAKPEDYRQVLADNYVMVDQAERRQEVWRQITQLAARENGWVKEDEELLTEVTFLLEWPTALCGNIQPEFLELPEEVVITPMREHQRYFPVYGKDGRLLPKFITVRDGNDHQLATVASGNEKVLRARLADASFFYQEDLKEPLEVKVERLKPIVFQARLGTMYQKMERLEGLSRFLAEQMELPERARADALRCARLAKADLVTGMVYEFPELQGIMGSYYAAHAGESEAVCRGIREHYQPRFAGDELPDTPVGIVVAVADKIDNIVGCFAVGLQPTGSQDPYALRRQALGICHILLKIESDLSLMELIKASYQAYGDESELKFSAEEVLAEVMAFFRQRIEAIMEEKGFKFDVVKSVLEGGGDNPTDVYRRCAALQAFREEEDFAALLTAFTRAANLAGKATVKGVDPGAFSERAESELYQSFLAVKQEADQRLAVRDYLGALRLIASLRQPIDNFFAGLIVMVDDERVRSNRLALLKLIADYIGGIANLSHIVQ